MCLFISGSVSLKPPPELETAQTETSEGCSRRSCFHSPSVTALTGHPWPPPLHLLIPLSLHAPPHPENEVMGAIRGRLDGVIRFTGQLIPHRTGWDCRNYGKERHCWDENTPIRSHGYLNIDYRLIDFHVQKKCDSNWTKDDHPFMCVQNQTNRFDHQLNPV